MRGRGWPFLAIAGACAALLVALALVLALQTRPGPASPELLVEGVPGGGSFPRGFGRLDELVPFAGGVNPVAEGVIPVEHAPEFRAGEWVVAQSPEAWTIQVMAAREEEAVKRFLAEREDRIDFSYFLFPQEGSYWYVVTVGSFPSRELAEGVAASKGLGAGQGQGFARRFGTYQEALRAAAAPAAEAPAAVQAPPPAPAPAPVLPAAPVAPHP
ncbi:MAG: SPOR domain-containing protein [Pseudomonadota bacterium]